MVTTAPLSAGARLPDALLRELGWPSPDAAVAVALFVRGPWCPVCRRQIARFAARADEFDALGARIYIVSAGETNVFTGDDRLGHLPVHYRNDSNATLIRALGIETVHPDHGVIARPATAIINRTGVIEYAYLGAHSRDRPEPAAILLAIRRLLQLA